MKTTMIINNRKCFKYNSKWLPANDNDNEATSFLVEQPPGVLHENYGPLQLDQNHSVNSDDSVLSDMELGIRRLQVASSSTASRLTDDILGLLDTQYTELEKQLLSIG